MNALLKSCSLWIALALSVIPAAYALEVDDPEHGFRFSLPDDFVRDPNPKNPENLHVYKRPPKEAGQLMTVVEVKALDGPVAVGERVNTSKLEVEPGFNVGFDQIEWQTHPLDMVILTPKDPAMSHVAVYTTIFPISGHAIRFRVTGAAGGADPARAFFDKTVASFSNTKPLHFVKSRSERRPVWLVAIKVGAAILALIAVIVRAARRAKEKKLQKKLQRLQQQQQPQAPGIRRPR